jgi:hypothetical protein
MWFIINIFWKPFMLLMHWLTWLGIGLAKWGVVCGSAFVGGFSVVVYVLMIWTSAAGPAIVEWGILTGFGTSLVAMSWLAIASGSVCLALAMAVLWISYGLMYNITGLTIAIIIAISVVVKTVSVHPKSSPSSSSTHTITTNIPIPLK